MNNMIKNQTGILHWGQKKVEKTQMSSYYDHTYYRIPVTGTVDIGKIYRVLREHKYPPQHNVFGGYCSLGTITDNHDGTVTVEDIYHIGE
jgi:hypothetical protein